MILFLSLPPSGRYSPPLLPSFSISLLVRHPSVVHAIVREIEFSTYGILPACPACPVSPSVRPARGSSRADGRGRRGRRERRAAAGEDDDNDSPVRQFSGKRMERAKCGHEMDSSRHADGRDESGKKGKEDKRGGTVRTAGPLGDRQVGGCRRWREGALGK